MRAQQRKAIDDFLNVDGRSLWMWSMANPVSLSSVIVDLMQVLRRFNAENDRSLPAVDDGRQLDMHADIFMAGWMFG